MATIEKLIKAFEGLKVFQPGGVVTEEATKKKETPPSKKDKMVNCNIIADSICAPNMRSIPDFPKFLGIAMEAFLTLCDDSETDVRLVADECLNRTIKILLETNLGRLQVELYKEIKKNGVSRSLRASLWRFADMCHLIRPQKCRPYIVNLLPCLVRICRRDEEAIQDTLATAMQKICPSLMVFANDIEVKALLKAFMPNLHSNSAMCRRTAASSLVLVCQHSRSPLSFISYLVSSLLEVVIPVDIPHDTYALLGVILCLRHVIPQLSSTANTDQGLKGSFGQMQRDSHEGVSSDHIQKLFQLLLYFTRHPDHNVATASLESLQQLLRAPPPQLMEVLMTKASIKKSLIFQVDLEEITGMSSENSLAMPAVSDDAELEDDADSSDLVSQSTNTSAETTELLPSELPTQTAPATEPNISLDAAPEDKNETAVASSLVVTSENNYSNVEIGEFIEEKSERSALSHSSSVETLLSIRSISPKQKPSLKRELDQDLNGNPSVFDPSEMQDSPLPSPLPPGLCEQRGSDVGSILGDEMPLVYCVRLLCRRFLLQGEHGALIPDKITRVSLKSLALGCIASSFTLCPQIFFYKLFPEENVGGVQDIRDVLLYASHPDPQLKGNTAAIIGSLVHKVLIEGRADFNKWLKLHSPSDIGKMTLEHLIEILINILEDDSSLATRQALSALQLCLSDLIQSCHGKLALDILLDLLEIKSNPYWLVKVELMDLLGGINFKVVNYLESTCSNFSRGHHFLGKLSLQDHYLKEVILPLLGDEDGRVRHAVARTLLRLIPHLFFSVDYPHHDPVMAYAEDTTNRFLHPVLHEWAEDPPPLVQGLVKPYILSPIVTMHPHIESSLSRIVHKLMHQLYISKSKHFTSGCCHALCLLAEDYLVTKYASSWGCGPATPLLPKESSSRLNMKRPPSRSQSTSSTFSLEDLTTGSGGGPVPVILALLVSSPTVLDLSTHQDVLQLAGNLIAGSAYQCLHPAEDISNTGGSTEDGRWTCVTDRQLAPLIDQLLHHVARLLNACSHVIDDQVPGPPQVKPSLPSLPNAPSLSPVKRRAKTDKDLQTGSSSPVPDSKTDKKTPQKDSKENEKDKKKKEGLGLFYNLPQYTKMYEVLRGAYSNYKTSLDLSSVDKFCSLLRTVLTVLAQILEIATLFDIGKHAEEFLGYLKSTIALEPTYTVLCVQQLLKALFGTNLANQWESQLITFQSRRPMKTACTSAGKPSLYECCLNQPYTHLVQSFAGATFRAVNQTDQDETQSTLQWLQKRVEKKVPAILRPGSKVDKGIIGSYIRLFEPLVIKALKQYTVTSSLDLQRQVLDLLSQLVQLRVNYCLLDSDQIFIGFVLKQFEFIEEGQIRNSELLVPHVFHFLVMLSYEKFHGKSIIDMPRIIHRCDGIMASGLQPTTHAIPALQHIVYDLFLLRGSAKSDVSKDLETQREVVVSMLIRLINYYQALEMFVIVLQQCHRESEEKWKRLSRQVMDMVLPALSKQQISLNNQRSLDTLHRLFESVAPSVFRPVDILLKTLFAPPANLTCTQGLQSWLCLVLSTLRVIIVQSKEDMVLSRLQEVGLVIPLTRYLGSTEAVVADISLLPDLTPEMAFAWLLLQVIGVSAETLSKESAMTDTETNECLFLVQQLLHLLLYVTHMFQSGLFRRVATAAMYLSKQKYPDCLYNIADINHFMLSLSTSFPTVTILWCNILILLNVDDENLWSQILHTPPKYLLVSPGHQTPSRTELPKHRVQCCRLELLRRVGLVLFSDYVCENLNDAEHMTWLIINHVSDIIELSHEPPVQDFISAIHRNSAASSLFIQAIHARCDNVAKPSAVKKTLRCLEAIHLSQSGALLTLLIDKFLNTHQLAVARMCDSIACRRVEMLLAEHYEECSKQLPQEDLEKLLQFMKSNGLIRRHARLVSLLCKLQTMFSPDCKPMLSPAKTHPLAVMPAQVVDIEINKDLYLSIVKDQCFCQNPNPRECAFLLQKIEYPDILSIAMTKEFSLSILEECISLGAYRTLVRYNRDRELTADQNLPPSEPVLDTLFKASHLTMFRHINNIVNHLSVPHQMMVFSSRCTSSQRRYMEHTEELFMDSTWFVMNFHITTALVQYLVAIKRFPWKPGVPAESVFDVCRFCVLCVEILSYLLHHDQLPTSEQLQTCLECVSLVLQNEQFFNLISQSENYTWVCALIDTIYQLVASLTVLPGVKVALLAHQDRFEEPAISSTDEFSCLIRACDQISELVHCLETRLRVNSSTSLSLPPSLSAPIRNIVIGLARLPLVNTYARTPPLVWKLGWSPSPTGELKTQLPSLPMDFLLEKDVLKEFVFRINTLGWVNRQQFEETWMSLLGLLNPATTGHDLTPEEEVERTQCMVIAIRAITSLLLQSTLIPMSGNPSNSVYEVQPRDKPLAFLQTRCGKKLSMVRGLIEQEIHNLCAQKPDRVSHHSYTTCRKKTDTIHCDLFEDNLDRDLGVEEFHLGQISMEAIWSVVGLVDTNMSESDTTDSADSPQHETTGKTSVGTSTMGTRERSLALSGLDIHSCLQFLQELYGPWLSCDGTTKPPLMLLNAAIRSIVLLSDLFMEREQFEWMLDTLLEVLRLHPSEDELVAQYLNVGICKAVAVVGSDTATSEKVIKLIEGGLRSTHLPSKVAVLHGVLYLLESGLSDLTRNILPTIASFLIKHLSAVNNTCITCQQFSMVMWATTFYIMENYYEVLKDTEFPSTALQLAVSAASASEDCISVTIFHTLTQYINAPLCC
ncbi:huntingtin-like isoform X2 [Gigantopelta aegis]|uniref:huntingtin-like isoform X2 n=1 Tax=Gigantopelta aegis TaxID=1735272 RepID=UPI001B88969A|nr:huntingtin-like isoform X2 [Gigantopelta aegis]